MDRRLFLKNAGIGLASFGFMAAAPEFLHQFAAAQTKGGYGRKKVLVTIFQRGAVDGLNMIVPYGEPEYYNLRRTLAIRKPGEIQAICGGCATTLRNSPTSRRRKRARSPGDRSGCRPSVPIPCAPNTPS